MILRQLQRVHEVCGRTSSCLCQTAGRGCDWQDASNTPLSASMHRTKRLVAESSIERRNDRSATLVGYSSSPWRTYRSIIFFSLLFLLLINQVDTRPTRTEPNSDPLSVQDGFFPFSPGLSLSHHFLSTASFLLNLLSHILFNLHCYFHSTHIPYTRNTQQSHR